MSTDSTVPGGIDEDHPGPDRRSVARRRRRRRRRRLAFVALGAVLLMLIGGLGVFYAAMQIPLPGQIKTSQVSTITYSDGKTVMARIGAQNRTDVPLSDVPPHVRWSVLAAEDRGYYGEPGVSFTGIARAAWADLRGGDVQGGSTITQQYVKNAYLTQQRTLSRKFKEIVIALKLDHQYSKDQILDWYLNTIYFGRGAYGIEAAAQTYFGKPVSALSTAEGAVLASSIRAPALYDPISHPDPAKARWHFVIDGMTKMGKLDQAQADALHYPKVRPIGTGSLNQFSGPRGYIVAQVKDELASAGFDEARLNRDGLRVVTTIDPRAQEDAQAAVLKVFHGQTKNLRQALVAVDPATGKVLAYYGGHSGYGFDYAQAWRQPGSSFKPYVLATALSQRQRGDGNISDYTKYNGSSPQTFGGVVVHNSDGESCGVCTVRTAMKMSLNTVFYKMGLQVGPDNVAATAHAAGVPLRNPDTSAPTLRDADGHTEAGISIGQYEVRPIDQAAGFATFADGGVEHKPYFVQKVIDASGRVLYQHNPSGRRAFSQQVANDTTYSMEQVASFSKIPLADARPTAAKTGTTQLGYTGQNKDAWMVGYTPQVSAAVWVGTDGSKPIIDATTGQIIYGRGLPGRTWQAFMNAYLSGKPILRLPRAHRDGPPGTSTDDATTHNAAPDHSAADDDATADNDATADDHSAADHDAAPYHDATADDHPRTVFDPAVLDPAVVDAAVLVGVRASAAAALTLATAAAALTARRWAARRPAAKSPASLGINVTLMPLEGLNVTFKPNEEGFGGRVRGRSVRECIWSMPRSWWTTTTRPSTSSSTRWASISSRTPPRSGRPTVEPSAGWSSVPPARPPVSCSPARTVRPRPRWSATRWPVASASSSASTTSTPHTDG